MTDTYNIQYKQGDIDLVGAILSDDDGVIDLTDKTVKLVMKSRSRAEPRYEISCTLGGTYQGAYYSAARGGVTIPFSAVETAAVGLFDGEFVVTGTGSTIHVPSGNNYFTVMIWSKL